MILAWLAASFLAGCVLGSWASLPPSIVVGVAALAAATAFLPRNRRARPALLVFACLCVGLARAPHAAGAPSPSDLRYYNGRHVALQGSVAAEPDVRDTGINYVVAVDRVTAGGGTWTVSGDLALHQPLSQPLDYGDEVSLEGYLSAPAGTYGDTLSHRGIYSQMGFARVLILGRGQSGPMGWIVPLRQALERGINAWLPEPEASLLIAITLGAHSASLGDLSPILVKSGLIHIIAISGIKVALVAGILFALARLLRRRLPGLVLPLAALAVYVMLTGATASGTRSAIMWSMVFLASYLGRGTVALVSLAVTLAAMVAVDPSLPWDIGFQLSAVGTCAIVVLGGPLGQRLKIVPSPLREALATTLAAQIGTFPIVVQGFHVLSGSAPLANMLVLPLLPALILLGFLLGAVAGVSAVAAPLSAASFAILHAVVGGATLLDRLPLNTPQGALSLPLTAAYYLGLGGIGLLILRRTGWAPVAPWPQRLREAGLAAAVALLGLALPMAHTQASPQARLYWLGTGSAEVLRAGSMTILIDGSPHPFQLLERLGQVMPYTVRTIDLVIVTDPQAGNMAGLDGLLGHYRVSEVLDVGVEYPSSTYARWRADLRRRGVPVFALRTRASVNMGAVTIRCLGPDALYPQPLDSAGLLRLSLSGRTVLLAGAASRREQLESVFRSVPLRADTVIATGKAGLLPAFLKAVDPRVVYASGPQSSGRRLHRLPQHVFSIDP